MSEWISVKKEKPNQGATIWNWKIGDSLVMLNYFCDSENIATYCDFWQYAEPPAPPHIDDTEDAK